MGNRANGAVGMIIQIIVVVNNGVKLRTKEQQQDKQSHLRGDGGPHRENALQIMMVK
jgi:hypothetical protein